MYYTCSLNLCFFFNYKRYFWFIYLPYFITRLFILEIDSLFIFICITFVLVSFHFNLFIFNYLFTLSRTSRNWSIYRLGTDYWYCDFYKQYCTVLWRRKWPFQDLTIHNLKATVVREKLFTRIFEGVYQFLFLLQHKMYSICINVNIDTIIIIILQFPNFFKYLHNIVMCFVTNNAAD